MTLTEQTFVRFKSHFTRANELRITALSSTDLQFADANAAIGSTTGTKISAPSGTDTGSVSVSGNRMYYCSSHGLGTSPAHTGRNCCSPHEGHIATATAFQRQGASNIFSTREDHPERNQRRNNNWRGGAITDKISKDNINTCVNNAHTISDTISSSNCSPPNSPTLIADTGCSAHFCATSHPLINVRPTTRPVHIRLPDGSTIMSTHDGELDIPALPIAARRAHIVPSLNGHPLISIGQLCDSGCDIYFSATSVTVHHKGTLIFSGTRNMTTKLWYLTAAPINHAPIHHFANARPHPWKFGHLCPCSFIFTGIYNLGISAQTWFPRQFPGLTATSLRKYPPTSRATIKGHLDQTRKNVRSTKHSTTHFALNAITDFYPTDAPHSDNNSTILIESIPVYLGSVLCHCVYDSTNSAICRITCTK